MRTACALLLVLVMVATVAADERLSFMAPIYSDAVDYWDVEGDGVVATDGVRLVWRPRQRSFMRTDVPLRWSTWELFMGFQVHTDAPHYGAEGLALWFRDQPVIPGPVIGATDRWRGLGVVLDLRDDDYNGDTPLLMGILNNGRIDYHPSDDALSQAIGHCRVAGLHGDGDKSNMLRVDYDRPSRTLRIWVATGEHDLKLCTDFTVSLPDPVYIGVTAVSGDAFDRITVTSLDVVQKSGPSDFVAPASNNNAVNDRAEAGLRAKLENAYQHRDDPKPLQGPANPNPSAQTTQGVAGSPGVPVTGGDVPASALASLSPVLLDTSTKVSRVLSVSEAIKAELARIDSRINAGAGAGAATGSDTSGQPIGATLKALATKVEALAQEYHNDRLHDQVTQLVQMVSRMQQSMTTLKSDLAQVRSALDVAALTGGSASSSSSGGVSVFGVLGWVCAVVVAAAAFFLRGGGRNPYKLP